MDRYAAQRMERCREKRNVEVEGECQNRHQRIGQSGWGKIKEGHFGPLVQSAYQSAKAKRLRKVRNHGQREGSERAKA